MTTRKRRRKHSIARAKDELIDPRKDQFARTMAYDSGIVSPEKDRIIEQHAREGYEKSSVRTFEKKPTEHFLPRKENKKAA